jgi:hypothetical protein
MKAGMRPQKGSDWLRIIYRQTEIFQKHLLPSILAWRWAMLKLNLCRKNSIQMEQRPGVLIAINKDMSDSREPSVLLQGSDQLIGFDASEHEFAGAPFPRTDVMKSLILDTEKKQFSRTLEVFTC